jgi:hypothetical protein
MDSFNAYAQRARDYASKAKDALSNPDAQKWFLVSVAIPAALFVILSPGLLLNLPANSEEFCKKQVPLPASSLASSAAFAGSCKDGIYVCSTAELAAGSGATCPLQKAQVLPICKKQKECRQYGASGYTGYGSIVLHAFVFVLLAYLINMGLRRGGITA